MHVRNALSRHSRIRNVIAHTVAIGLCLSAPAFAAGEDEEKKPADSALPVEGACAGVMPAADVVTAMVRELYSLYRRGAIKSPLEQKDYTYKYLALLAPDINDIPEDPIERLALGEALFLNFRAVEARRHYDGLRERDDIIGRLAWQRMMQMAFTPEDEGEAMKTMLADYRKKYPASPLDLNGPAQQLRNLASMHLSNGEKQKALELIMREIEAIPTDAPYRTYRLAEAFQSEFDGTEREASFKSLLRAKLKDLRATRRRMEKSDPPASDDPMLKGAAPTWYWIQQDVRDGETFHTARIRQLKELEEKLAAIAG